MRALIALVAPALLLTGCGSRPEMTRQEARTFVRRALADAGVDGVSVGREVAARECGRPPVAGWWTTSRVAAGGSVVVCVERRGDEIAYVRDAGPKGGPLLDDAQVRRLDRFSYDPVTYRRDRSVPRAVAVGLLVGVSTALWLTRRRQTT